MENNTNNFADPMICYCSAIAVAGKQTIRRFLNNGDPAPVIIRPRDNGKVEVLCENGESAGYLLASDDINFTTCRAKEPAINNAIGADQLLKVIGSSEITATAIAAQGPSIIKIRIDPETLASTPEVTDSKVEEKEAPVDLSAFDKKDAEEIKKRLAYMKTLKFPAKVRKNLNAAFVSFMQTHTGIRTFEPIFINNNGIMETCIKNFLAGNNLALTGPKGVGKNILVEHLANLFDLELCDMQMSYDTAKEEVRGEPTFLEDGKIGVRLSNIVDAAQRPAIINLDEVNMARGSITSLLHSLTDHRRYIEIPGYGMVKVHPQARFTITMNEGDEYEGTRQLNVAFRDRFHEVVFKPNPDNMKDVFMDKCNLNEKDATELAKFYKLIHSAVYTADNDACIPDDYLSQRKFVRAGCLYSMGFTSSIKEAFQEEVIDTIADPEIKGVLEQLITMHY